jgi:hypothetical protein
VPAFIAMIAFITATLVFVVVGSNPIVSVGADSTCQRLSTLSWSPRPRLSPVWS